MSRSKWKPLFIDEKKINLKNKINKIYKRNMLITSKHVDNVIQIHNGTRFYEVIITKNMIGQRFGEFSPSKVKPMHKKKNK